MKIEIKKQRQSCMATWIHNFYRYNMHKFEQYEEKKNEEGEGSQQATITTTRLMYTQ